MDITLKSGKGYSVNGDSSRLCTVDFSNKIINDIKKG